MTSSPPIPTPNQSAASRLAVLFILCLCALYFWPILSFWFTGIDALPVTLSNRVLSWSDVPSLLTRKYLAAYEGEEISGSVGVRPAGSAFFAIDYSLWGLRASGYHLTDLLLHSLNALLVFLLAKRLRPGHGLFVPLCASTLFAIHPLHSATVPLIPGRYDLVMCMFSLCSVIALLRYLRSGRTADLVLCLVAAALAVSAKEMAVVTIAILGFTVVYSAATSEIRPRNIWMPLGLLFLVAVAFVVYRSLVVQGLGGYPVQRQDLIGRPIIFAKRFLAAIVCPLPLAPVSWAVALQEVLIGSFAALKGFLILGATFTLFRRTFAPFAWLERQMGPDARLVALLTAWEFAFFGGLGAAHSLMGVFKPLYVYTPLAFWCIVLAILILHAAQYLKKRWGHSFARSAADYVVVLSAVLLVALTGSLLATAPRLRKFDNWATAAEMGKRYIAAVDEAVERLPGGATLLLVNLPREIDCGEGGCVGRSFILEGYSIDSWRKLSAPHENVRIVSLSALRLKPAEKDLASTVEYDPTGKSITVRNGGGDMAPPWNPKKPCVQTEIEMEPGRPRRLLHIRLIGDLPAPGTCYLLDPFAPAKLFELGPAGLRPVEVPATR